MPDPVRVASLRDIIERVALRDSFGLVGIASTPEANHIDVREAALLMRAVYGRSRTTMVETSPLGMVICGPHRVHPIEVKS